MAGLSSVTTGCRRALAWQKWKEQFILALSIYLVTNTIPSPTVGAGYSVGAAVAAGVALRGAGLAVGRGRCTVVPVGAATPVRFRTAAMGALKAPPCRRTARPWGRGGAGWRG